MFVAVFVAVKRTEFTRVYLYIQLSQQISVYPGTDAHATPADVPSRFISAFMSLMFPSWNRCIFSIDFGLRVTVVAMKAPIFVRSFSDREREPLESRVALQEHFHPAPFADALGFIEGR
jgi:hypothetical protein